MLRRLRIRPGRLKFDAGGDKDFPESCVSTFVVQVAAIGQRKGEGPGGAAVAPGRWEIGPDYHTLHCGQGQGKTVALTRPRGEQALQLVVDCLGVPAWVHLDRPRGFLDPGSENLICTNPRPWTPILGSITKSKPRFFNWSRL